jgi:methionyl-tRNA formyltransferase
VPKRQKPARERAELLARSVEGRLVGAPLVQAWSDMLRRYDAHYPRLPATRVIRVDNVNDPPTLALLDELTPDVVLVSGTNLVGKGIVERGKRRHGVLNLHTGISPYVKGGPNCTNWCLAKGWFHLIGSTVMWLDLGIDTGDIVMTERTSLDGTESLSELQFNVMDHGHDMYVRAVAALASGMTLPRVPQRSIAEGTTFYTREWGALPMMRAQYNFLRRYRRSVHGGAADGGGEQLQLVPLPA